MSQNKFQQSPMNYTGNKYRLLPQILPLFPDDSVVDTFYDAFCGGLSVSLNVPYKKIHCSDVERQLIGIYTAIKQTDNFEGNVDACLAEYAVTPDNEDGFMRMRQAYNESVHKRPEMLFALLATAYNALYRFNSKGEYNAPFGFDKNTFNQSKRTCLRKLIEFLKNPAIILRSCAYHDLLPQAGDFVYCDPPYLITGAAYNKSWNLSSEYALLRWLDTLNENGVLFGVSNVLRHQGRINVPLLKWAEHYNIHELNHRYTTYANGKHRDFPTQEVYICNH